MQKRTNQEWVEQLRGDHGQARQESAHQDLAGYLYRVVYNYLKGRQAQANPYILASYLPEQLAALAQDFVQETLEKLVDEKLLAQFEGKGSFTSWVAVIVGRQAAQELRKSYWNRRDPLPSERENGDEEPLFEFASKELSPENATMRHQLGQAIQACLQGLKESRRLAFRGVIVEERRGKEVAFQMDKTEHAVFSLVYNAKRDLRKCLRQAGWDRDVLEIFNE